MYSFFGYGVLVPLHTDIPTEDTIIKLYMIIVKVRDAKVR